MFIRASFPTNVRFHLIFAKKNVASETFPSFSYKVSIYDVNVTNENFVVDVFSCSHPTGYSAQNVSHIWFWTGTLEYIPRGIGQKFKNLEKFTVGYSDRNLGLKKLRRSNFKDMESLWYLDVSHNDVETVDEDTLRDLPNLIHFVVSSNKLRILHKNVFQRNFKLQYINANSNLLEFLHDDLFKNNALLVEASFNNNKLMTILIDFTRLKFIGKIDFHKNTCVDVFLDRHNLTEYQTILNSQCGGIQERHLFS